MLLNENVKTVCKDGEVQKTSELFESTIGFFRKEQKTTKQRC